MIVKRTKINEKRPGFAHIKKEEDIDRADNTDILLGRESLYDHLRLRLTLCFAGLDLTKQVNLLIILK